MPDPIVKTLRIVNEKGLHARASARLVEVVEGFNAQADISRDGMSASGDSIMGLLMLGAARGSTIEMRVTGPEAAALAAALERLVAERFGEDT
ncbi:HPr family phosphocarrier protein [Meridianimarinicoccus sp. RP-17]|uniref:HPr family phosphocarrier protein n=1 Tax=Meridianimarinicoccus zhengii TaxID=2056810 RepID=UPI000DAD0D63|nr:HPr family phosphocarrier protein [Phycocomes zhengii]